MTTGLQNLMTNGNDITMAIHRFRDNESTYVCYLKKFLMDPTYEQFKFCLSSADYETAKSYCSALCGVTANLGLTNISRITGELTQLLYTKNFDSLEQPLKNLETEYTNTISLIDRV